VSNRGKAPPPRGKVVTAPNTDSTSDSTTSAPTSAPISGDADGSNDNADTSGPISESKDDTPAESTGKSVTINAGENQRKRTSIFSGMKSIGKASGAMSNKETLKAMGFDTPKEVDFNVKEAEKSAKQQLSQLRANERIKDLEAEVFDLQRKLDRSNSRLAQQPGSADALSRETELENELSSSTEKLVTQRNVNRSLEVTVKELQKRLTQAEHDLLVGGAHNQNSQISDNMDFNEGQKSRVTLLEEHLVKTKRDKDRAIRVLISILGKDKIASFLDIHAGSPDILDALQQHFMQQKFMLAVDDNSRAASNDAKGSGPTGPKGGMKRKPAKKVKMNTAPQNILGAGRSRMDEYFSTSNVAGYGV
jgi:hypothetical protein